MSASGHRRPVRWWRRRPSIGMQAAAVLLGLTLIGLSGVPRGVGRELTVQIDMSTTTATGARLYPGIGGAYDEATSQALPVVNDGARHVYEAAIGAGPMPDRLRLDPGTGPGPVVLHEIRIGGGSGSRVLAGPALIEGVKLLNELQRTGSRTDVLELQSTGNDPFLDFALPQVPPARRLLLEFAGLVLLGSGLGLLAGVTLLHRGRIARWFHGVGERRYLLLAVFSVLALMVLLIALDTGCDRSSCSPRGLRYGSALFAAVLGFSLVGAALFRIARLDRGAVSAPGLIAASLAGQVVLVAYVYVRSLIHSAVGFLPLTSVELLVVVAASGIYLARSSRRVVGLPVLPAVPAPARWTPHERGWFVIRLCLVAVVCVVVADRELPRLVMLSSDPDTHAFLARQLQRMGGIYRSQGDWGPDPLGYPAGSASMIFSWSSLSFLGMGNALAAMPLLLAFLSSMAIGETIARRIASLPARVLVLFTMVGITSAGFLFPIYTRFAHLEGAGRQVGIGAVALLVVGALLVGQANAMDRRAVERRFAIVATLALFLLAALNPINLLIPGIFIAAHAVLVLLSERRLSWWLLAPVGCVAMLTMDPYYLALMSGRPGVGTFTLVGDYVHMGVRDMVAAWLAVLAGPSSGLLRPMLQVLPEQGAPAFALLLAAFALPLLATRWTPRRPAATAFVVVLVLVGAYLVSALLQAVSVDARLYLLAAYLPFSLAQYKLMLLLCIAGWVLVTLQASNASARRLAAVALLMVAVTALEMRNVQPMHMAPRHDYCGSMGCVQPSDIAVVDKLQALVAAGSIPRIDGHLPRILVPNTTASTGNERWIFPTGASRYLAMSDTLPVAFFYYQGDSDFTTASYDSHVCERFDRAWMARERIAYVFLPAERGGTCIAQVESLRSTDTVVAREGDSYLIRLEPQP